MKNRTSLRGLRLASLTTLLLLVLCPEVPLIAYQGSISSQSAVPRIGNSDNQVDSNNALLAKASMKSSTSILQIVPLCPTPSVRLGDQCILTRDFTLDETLVLPSDTTLNCQGHTLSARVTPTPEANSQPQVGIFLNGVRNVLIQRCVIEGFDFGIFAINSKRPELTLFQSFVMVDNTINARYTGVSLMSVDDAEIISNNITYTRAGGSALYIGRNSDSNGISKNSFVANLTAGDANARAFRAPGPELPANPVLPPPPNPNVPPAPPGSAVVITSLEGSDPTLLNLLINRKLIQLRTPVPNSLAPNPDFSEGNRFEGNTLLFSGVSVDGLVLSISQGTQVRGNTVGGGSRGAMRIGMQMGQGTEEGFKRVFPGTCALEPSRRCLGTDDCKIPGFDLTISKGPCEGVRTVRVFWLSRDITIQNNVITGPLGFGINTTGQSTTIIGNTIDGRNPETGAGTGAGIQLIARHALANSNVRRNSVSNVSIALGLVQSIQAQTATSFTAKVSLNDFTSYKTAVSTLRIFPTPTATPASHYSLKSELSVGGRGNFWGPVSRVGSLCLGLLPEKVINSEDESPNAKVTDPKPYDISVAKTPLALVPLPCKPQVVGP